MRIRRRDFLVSAGALFGSAAIGNGQTRPGPQPAMSAFPTTAPSLAQEAVRRAHFPDSQPLAELLADDRSLALAGWDWGFGDWETALGAASHMGRRETAELLMQHGARPNLFTLAMLDHVDAVRAVCAAIPGVQRTRGPHGITLLQHARTGDATRVIEYLESLGDADVGRRSLPVDSALHDVYAGTYGSDEMGANGLVVAPAKRGGLTIRRADGTPRALDRIGEHEFHPAGAPHVIIRFVVTDGRAERLIVDRGRAIVSAKRVAP